MSIAVENITTAWVDRHAEFTQTELYKNYYECMLAEREKILMDGKRTRDPHSLSKLEGFDQAASFFQRCVDRIRSENKQGKEDQHEFEPGY